MKNKVLNKEVALYILFGILTTAVNYIVFLLFSLTLGYDKVLLINTLAFICAVIFAFITNKLFVFESKSWSFKVLIREISTFVAARIFSFIFEEIGLFISSDILHLEKFSIFGIDGILISKAVLNIIVIILNWIFSKFIIFKRKEKL